MIVISLTSVPQSIKGYLTKYLWEINTGVFVGAVNARIRNLICGRICENTKDVGKAIMVYDASNEQGFNFEVVGSSWVLVDYEGLKLILHPNSDSNIYQETESKNDTCTTHFENKEYVIIDLETTGLDPDKNDILEIGAIRIVDGEEKEVFERIISVHVPDDIAELTGITQDMADGGVNLATALNDFNAYLNGSKVIGYNIRMFDIRFLKKAYAKCDIPFPIRKIIDVLDRVRSSFPNSDSYRLRDISNMLGIVVRNGNHRALEDCRICAEVYKRCM